MVRKHKIPPISATLLRELLVIMEEKDDENIFEAYLEPNISSSILNSPLASQVN